MLKKIKSLIFNFFSYLIEIIVAFILLLFSLVVRCTISRPNSIFMGMMHIKNLTYVAKALRKEGYYVQVVPWIIPEHEKNVIPYDVQLQKEYPILYSTFPGQYILQFWIFIWTIFNFEVFITPFRSRILERTIWLNRFEIPLLHLAGKKVILNSYGADVAMPRLKRRKDLKYSLYDGYINDPQYTVSNEVQ